MLVLGLSGGFDPLHDSVFRLEKDFAHDAAAVLLRGREVVAGIEEERLTRIKHTNKTWGAAARFCLAEAGVGIEDVDRIALYSSEQNALQALRFLRLHRPDTGPLRTPRGIFLELLERELGVRPDPSRLRFVNHHDAHVTASLECSGFDEALVLSVDGAGDDLSTVVLDVRGDAREVLLRKGIPDSLGFLYLEVIRFLGYTIFEEYKVMGLAPYGDPARFRERMSDFYTLGPDGDYQVHKERVMALYEDLVPRSRGEPFEQVHEDLAASLQEAIEEIVGHVLRHFQERTGHTRLVLAGGVAQNSSMNGKLLRSGLFREVFAPSFSADQGCALGAALAVVREEEPALPRARIDRAYWGTDVGDEDEVRAGLEAWGDLLEVERLEDRSGQVAARIAAGEVVGWVQGRSEFGPRALGNRSILADPRVGSHKQTINAMIKKREGYRPFAPSIREERVRDVFEVPGDSESFPYMACVLEVKEERREELPAITHVDGTARLQTVTEEANPRFWELLGAFEERTGLPVLLNTSFNNNVEPIVDDLDDAVVCYLTSGLDTLVVGDFLATKRALTPARIGALLASVPPAARLYQEVRADGRGDRVTEHFAAWNYEPLRRRPLSPEAYALLAAADGARPVGALVEEVAAPGAREALHGELLELWSERLVILRPRPGHGEEGAAA